MYDNITLEEYKNLLPTQRKNVKREKVQQLFDEHLNQKNINDQDLKKFIADAIKEAITNELKELDNEVKSLRTEMDRANNERGLLKKILGKDGIFLVRR